MTTAYATVIEATAYTSARGLTPAPDDEALLRASEYIDARYRDRFSGRKTGGRTQDKEWPRTGAVDAYGDAIPSNEIPEEVKHATIEAAVRSMANPASLAPDVVPGTIVKKAEVDGAVSVEYFGSGNPADMLPVYSVIDGILEPVLVPMYSGVGITLIR